MNSRTLQDKNAVIYGGGGAIGSAVARAFARHGATVFLAGRSRSKLESVAADIASQGGVVETAEVDALDEEAVNRHADAVAAKAGHIDIALNAVGLLHLQGPPFLAVSLADFSRPIHGYTQTNFITAKAVARHMVERRSGVILTLSTPGSRGIGTGYLGYGVTCSAIEGFSRLLACDLGPRGVRVVCLRSHAIPEASAQGSHSNEVFRPVAEAAGTTVQGMLAQAARTTLLERLPTLDQVANTAAFMASEHANAITGAIVNLSCGSLVD